jgi:hypothetical protein
LKTWLLLAEFWTYNIVNGFLYFYKLKLLKKFSSKWCIHTTHDCTKKTVIYRTLVKLFFNRKYIEKTVIYSCKVVFSKENILQWQWYTLEKLFFQKKIYCNDSDILLKSYFSIEIYIEKAVIYEKLFSKRKYTENTVILDKRKSTSY